MRENLNTSAGKSVLLFSANKVELPLFFWYTLYAVPAAAQHWITDAPVLLPGRTRTAIRGRIRITKKRLCLILVFLFAALLPIPLPGRPVYGKYTAQFYDVFDTFVAVTAYAESEEQFNEAYEAARELFLRYHKIYDGYHAWGELGNLYRMNQTAPAEPCRVEREMIDLLLWAKANQPIGRMRVNIALGSVLSIWHSFREEGLRVPAMADLRRAAEHTDFDSIRIDAEKCEVFYTDPECRVDLGAVAKGYTAERAAEVLEKYGLTSYLINAGGNVRCGAAPKDGRKHWGIAIQNPFLSEEWMDVVYTQEMSVVTSGDYQRFYTVDGVRYHHIIDPDTLMPSDHMRQVTVVCRDSALADLLSTALFNLSPEDGWELAAALEGTEAYWVLKDGSVLYTPGMKNMLQSNGASSSD